MPRKTSPSSPQGAVPADSSSFCPSQAPIAIGTAIMNPTWPRIAAFERAPPGGRGAAKATRILLGKLERREQVREAAVRAQADRARPRARVRAVVDDHGRGWVGPRVREDRPVTQSGLLRGYAASQ